LKAAVVSNVRGLQDQRAKKRAISTLRKRAGKRLVLGKEKRDQYMKKQR
jgi:hypothetical protein